MVLRAWLLVSTAAVAAIGPHARAELSGPISAAPAEAPFLVAGTAPRGIEGVPGPAHDAWRGSTETPLLLSRTPPLYEGDPMDDGVRPDGSIRLLRTGDDILVRLAWEDPTDSRPRPPESIPDAGDDHVYPAHSMDIERFADGACVMVPRTRGPRDVFPSLMMGDAADPVDLYYWNRTLGFERLEARGRGTTSRTGEAFPGDSRRTSRGWVVVVRIPDVPPGTPISVAFWDGGRDHRDGLKFFSPWYEVRP
ncbi:MAG: hypothetical protein ABIK65_12750 [Candidatus Eisenbacteria bacterium]